MSEINILNKKKIRIILQIDGGGIRGITPSIVLDALTNEVNSKRTKENKEELIWYRDLSLCCGTSTGAIMAAMICAGVSTKDTAAYYIDEGSILFKKAKRAFYAVWEPKYDREEFVNAFKDILAKNSISKNPNVTLKDMKNRGVLFMATAFNLCSMRTHFIKSDKDETLLLSDVVTWSGLSAAWYFGNISVPSYKWDYINADAPPITENNVEGAVFQDGGQGTQNCTLAYALTEIFSNNWHNEAEKVILISLGTGNKTAKLPYYETSKLSMLDQVKKFITEARTESLPVQSMAAKYISENKKNNITVYRLDYEFKSSSGLDKDYDLDDIDNISIYKKGAENIINGAIFKQLCDDLTSLQ